MTAVNTLAREVNHTQLEVINLQNDVEAITTGISGLDSRVKKIEGEMDMVEGPRVCCCMRRAKSIFASFLGYSSQVPTKIKINEEVLWEGYLKEVTEANLQMAKNRLKINELKKRN